MNHGEDLGSLAAIAEQLGGRVIGDGDVRIAGVASVEEATAGMLTFATDARYLRAAFGSKASAVLTDEAALAGIEGEARKPLVVVAAARAALAALLGAYEAPRTPGIHPSAVIDPSARVGPDAQIEPGVVVGARAQIGARATLRAGAVIGADARVGDDVVVHPRACILDRCVVGDRVVLQAGAVVGSDGFGYVLVDGAFVKIPQVGIVQLGNDVEIGANACVDRAQTGATTIGDGSKIDNLCQIGHNVRIGKHSAFAAFNGLAGTTVIGDYVRSGGKSAFRGHVTVGSRVTIAGNTMVWGDVPDDAFISGHPAQDHRTELRWQATLRKVPNLLKRVDSLEKQSRG